MTSQKLFTIIASLGVLFGGSAWAQNQKELNCVGIYRKVIPLGKTVEVTHPLLLTYNNPKTIKAEVDFEQGIYMSATWDLGTSSILMSITEAPDYLNGINTRVSIENGRASLSQTKIESTLSLAKNQTGETIPVMSTTGNFFVFRLVCDVKWPS